MEPAIRVERLCKTFGKHGKALHEIQLSIQPGEMVALIGPSGSGKSTLLRHMAGLACGDRSSGRIAVSGNAIQDSGRLDAQVRQARARIGYIFQQFNLVNRMSVMNNVLVGALGRLPSWRGCLGWFGDAERRLALESLRRVGMETHADKRASCLSGGQQQRVAIARCMTQQAEVILADEPIASLDPESARRVMEILKDLNERDGKTVVVTLHQVDYARQYCRRAVALKQGRVLFDGDMESLTPQLLNELYGTSHFDDEPETVSVHRPPMGGLALAN